MEHVVCPVTSEQKQKNKTKKKKLREKSEMLSHFPVIAIYMFHVINL